jgi:hypothetical protein
MVNYRHLALQKNKQWPHRAGAKASQLAMMPMLVGGCVPAKEQYFASRKFPTLTQAQDPHLQILAVLHNHN